jgi:lipopolysaccharide/colanic/teichoic acid biosynthesis glycosyltransferase
MHKGWSWKKIKMYQQIKALLDFFVSLIALIILAPVMVIVVLLLYLLNHRKVFFIQARPGKKAKIFKLIKFKTMNDKVGPDGKLLPDRDRLTGLGKFIRTTSIDELPQLLNVLKGDMSLVGPRPLLPKYLPLYTEQQMRRHEDKPGITGWAQVNGRNAISWKKKFEYDIWYVDNAGFLLDLKIIWMTIIKVFKRESINAQGSATIAAFDGNN